MSAYPQVPSAQEPTGPNYPEASGGTQYPSAQEGQQLPPGVLPPNLPDQKSDPAIYQTGAPGAYPASGPYPGGGQYGFSPPQGGQYGQYPPPGQPPPGYASGYHVMGYPAELPDPILTPEERARERTGVLCGSMTLIFGFCLPFFWLVGACLPCCFPSSLRLRWLACANSLAFVIATLLLVLLPVMLVGVARH